MRDQWDTDQRWSTLAERENSTRLKRSDKLRFSRRMSSLAQFQCSANESSRPEKRKEERIFSGCEADAVMRRKWLTFQVHEIPPILDLNCSEQSMENKEMKKKK